MRLSRIAVILEAQALIYLAMSLWLGWEASMRIESRGGEMARLLGVAKVLLPIGTAWLAGLILFWFASPLETPNGPAEAVGRSGSTGTKSWASFAKASTRWILCDSFFDGLKRMLFEARVEYV